MEKDFLQLNWSNAEVKEAGSRTLIGRILTKRNLNKNTVKLMIIKACTLKSEVKIIEGENRCLLFSFGDFTECARVFEIGHGSF